MLRRGALQSFTRCPPPSTTGDRQLSHPPSLGAHQSIRPLSQPQGSLLPSTAIQCPCWVSCSPPAVSAPPTAHVPSPQVPGVKCLIPSWPLVPPTPPHYTMGFTCCPSPHSGVLPSSRMAQPVSGVPGGKIITDPIPFQRPQCVRTQDQNMIISLTLLTALHALTYSILARTLHEGTIIVIPILQRKKSRPRKLSNLSKVTQLNSTTAGT